MSRKVEHYFLALHWEQERLASAKVSVRQPWYRTQLTKSPLQRTHSIKWRLVHILLIAHVLTLCYWSLTAHLFNFVDAQWVFPDGFTVGNTTEDSDTNNDKFLFIVATLQHVFAHRLANKLHHSSLCTSSDDPRTCSRQSLTHRYKQEAQLPQRNSASAAHMEGDKPSSPPPSGYTYA